MAIQFNDSPEKQRIREELWKVTLKSLPIMSKNIKYLGLPGAKCFCLKKFIEEKLINIHNVVSVERKKPFFEEIMKFYGEHTSLTTKEQKVYLGEIETLIKQKNFISKVFPLNVINLDLYDSPLDNKVEGESKIFDLIEKLISIQQREDKDFYLMITIKLEDARSLVNARIKSFDVFEHILSPIQKKYPGTLLEQVLVQTPPLKKEEATITAIILRSVMMSRPGVKVKLFLKPYTYIGTGMKTRMLSYVLEIKYSKQNCSIKKTDSEIEKSINEATGLITQTVKIN